METLLLFAVDAKEQTPAGFFRYLPAIVLTVLFVWFVISYAKVLRRSKPLHDRSLEHMNRIEAKTDEMIALLKEIRDKLGSG